MFLHLGHEHQHETGDRSVVRGGRERRQRTDPTERKGISRARRRKRVEVQDGLVVQAATQEACVALLPTAVTTTNTDG